MNGKRIFSQVFNLSMPIQRLPTLFCVCFALALSPVLTQAKEVEPLGVLDQRVLEVSQRLLIANADKCPQTMATSGLLLHSRDQYDAVPAATVTQLFPGNTRLAISTVMAGSPSDNAGLQPGDAVQAIGELEVGNMNAPASGQLRLSVFDKLAEMPHDKSIDWQILRNSERLTVAVQTIRACRALVEVVPSRKRFARSDGKFVQVSSRLVRALDEEQLAVVLSHEIAHVALAHRQHLSDNDVKKGLLGQFGKSRKLSREAEIEADRLSVHLLAAAGYDPTIGPQFWRSKIGKKLSGGLLRSRVYPSAKNRAEMMEEEVSLLLASK